MPPDHVVLNPGVGGDTMAAKLVAGVKHQQVLTEYDVGGTPTPVSASAPLPVAPSSQVTEDAAAAADPVGIPLMARRRDSPTTETSTNGDQTALNCTGKGELYVKSLDNASEATLVSLGTALAAWLTGGVQLAQLVGDDGTTAAVVKATTPTGSEKGLIVRPILAKAAASTAAWTSATGVDTALTVDVANAASAVLLLAVTGGTITAGSINFEGTLDGSTWFSIEPVRVKAGMGDSAFDMTNAASGAKVVWRLDVAALQQIRVRLNPVITGAGTANVVVLRSPASTSAEPLNRGIGQELIGTAASVANFSNLGQVDVSQFRSAFVQLSGFGTATATWEVSNDGTTWIAVPAQPIGNPALNNATTTTATANGQWVLPLSGKYFRVRLSAYTSGTITATVELCYGEAVVLIGNQGAGQLADNAAFTDGTTRVNMAGYIFDETAGTALSENDGGAARMDSKRAVITAIEDATTRGQRLAVSLQGAAAAAGDVAHDSADAGAPVKIGAKAVATLDGATMVADGDRTNLVADVDGVLLVRVGVPIGDVRNARLFNTDGNPVAFTGDFAAPGAGLKLVLKTLILVNSSGTFCSVDVRDGTGGSILATIALPATDGKEVLFDPPLVLSANTALAIDVSAAITTVTATALGYATKA